MKRRSFLQGAATGALTLFFARPTEAAPIVPTKGYIRSTFAPASQTCTGTPGTFDAVRSEV